MKEAIRFLRLLPQIGIVTIKAWSTASIYLSFIFPQGRVKRTIRLSDHYKENAIEDIQIIFKKGKDEK